MCEEPFYDRKWGVWVLQWTQKGVHKRAHFSNKSGAALEKAWLDDNLTDLEEYYGLQ
jgi:hypothetical protein